MLLTVLAWAALPAAAHAAVQVVTPRNLAGWQAQFASDGDATNTASVTFVPGPATPPLGTGSVVYVWHRQLAGDGSGRG